MNARDELAEVIRGIDGPATLGGFEVADAILSAGYRKPRTITTTEELYALPVGSVILDPVGLSLHKNAFTGWTASNGAKGITEEMLNNEALPATVLYEGEAA